MSEQTTYGRNICDHCERRRVIVFAGFLPREHPLGWGKFCAECLPVVLEKGQTATAKEDGPMAFKHADPCLAKVADDEPIFTLRAQDKLAANLVRDWADAAESAGCSPAKVAEARACADAMEQWPHRKYPD